MNSHLKASNLNSYIQPQNENYGLKDSKVKIEKYKTSLIIFCSVIYCVEIMSLHYFDGLKSQSQRDCVHRQLLSQDGGGVADLGTTGWGGSPTQGGAAAGYGSMGYPHR